MTRRYTRSSAGNAAEPKKAPESNFYEVEGFPDDILEPEKDDLPRQPESGPLEYVPTAIIREDANGFELEYDDSYDNVKPQEKAKKEESKEEEEEEYVAPVTRRSSTRKTPVKKEQRQSKEEEYDEDEEDDDDEDHKTSKKKSSKKKEKKEEPEENDEKDAEKRKKKEIEKERKRKEKERRELDSQLEAELRAAHGGGRSAKGKKKPEKPAYVGGLPTAPIQTDPVVSNPYNYDPRMEMTKLGTGQLKSAYRKTRNNVELHIEKNLYKLEPKRESHSGSESRDQSEEPDHSETPVTPHDRYNQYQPHDSHYDDYDGQKPAAKRFKYEPISVDTTPLAKKKDSRQSSSQYTPSIASPSPSAASSSSNNFFQKKSSVTSPSVYSPSEPKERRLSDATSSSAMKKGVYMPAMSRQDKMIAEAGALANPSSVSSRHSSMSSERRPSFIPDFSSSRNSSMDGSSLYTPTAPLRSSWLPNTSNVTRQSIDDDSPIDVVNSPMHSPHTPISLPPVTLKDLEYSNGKRKIHDEKKKIPAKEAVAELKTLIGKLKNLNEA